MTGTRTTAPDAPGGVRTVRLVAQREIVVGSRRRSYRVTAALMLLLGVVAAIAPHVLGDDGPSRWDVAVVGEPPPGFGSAIDRLAREAGGSVEVRTTSSAEAAEELVRTDDVDAAVVWAAEGAGDEPAPPQLLVPDPSSDRLVAVLGTAAATTSTVERLRAAGLPADAVTAALAPPPSPRTVAGSDDTPRAAVGFVVVFVLYLVLLTAGAQVAGGVAVEKSNRIAESLLSSVRPSLLLAGKVAGTAVLALVPLLLASTPVLLSWTLGGQVDVPSGAIGDVAAGIGWFLLGFGLYSSAYAALGALVDRQEEVGSAVAPMTALLLASFVLATQAQNDPDSPLATASSLFPLTAPMVMPMRISTGDPSTVEVVLAVSGVVVTAAVVARLAAVVYRRALVRTGRRLRLRDVRHG